MNRSHTVSHPDGTVSKRGSKTREYVAAVVVETARETLAASADREAAICRGLAETARIAATGEVTETRRSWSWGGEYVSLFVGGEWADSYTTEKDERPTDEQLRAKLQKKADELEASARDLVAKADKLRNGPERYFSVIRWSQTREAAERYSVSSEALAIARGDKITVEEVSR